MARFETFESGRFRVHVWSSPQFQTRSIHLKCVRPIAREVVTSTAMLPYLWLEGTASAPSAKDLMQRADDLFGCVIRTGIGKRADRHVAEVYTALPEESHTQSGRGLFDAALQLTLEVLLDPLHDGPAFPARHVERERTLHERRIDSVFDDKIAYAMERCLETVFGDHPAGLPRLGYREDLPEQTGATLWQAYQELLRVCEVHLYVVGQIEDARRLAEHCLSALTSRLPERAERSWPNAVPVQPRGGDVRYPVDEQVVQQGKLNLCWRTGIGYASSDYPALLVCNGILGGFPHSKLFVGVREKASLAYYASSRLDALTGVVLAQTGIEVGNYERALAIILDQVRALQDGHITDDELEYTKRGLRNQYLQLLDQPMSLADLHFTGVLAGAPREVTDLIQAVEAVTKEDVVRAAQRLALDTVYFLRSPLQTREVKTHG